MTYCRFEKDGIDVGERTAEGHAVSCEHCLERRALTHLESVSVSNAFYIPMGAPQAHLNSVEGRRHSFQLLVVTQDTLALITIVLGG